MTEPKKAEEEGKAKQAEVPAIDAIHVSIVKSMLYNVDANMFQDTVKGLTFLLDLKNEKVVKEFVNIAIDILLDFQNVDRFGMSELIAKLPDNVIARFAKRLLQIVKYEEGFWPSIALCLLRLYLLGKSDKKNFLSVANRLAESQFDANQFYTVQLMRMYAGMNVDDSPKEKLETIEPILDKTNPSDTESPQAQGFRAEKDLFLAELRSSAEFNLNPYVEEFVPPSKLVATNDTGASNATMKQSASDSSPNPFGDFALEFEDEDDALLDDPNFVPEGNPFEANPFELAGVTSDDMSDKTFDRIENEWSNNV